MSRMRPLSRVARGVVTTYVRSVLGPVEGLSRLVRRERFFDDALSVYRDRKIEVDGVLFDASHPRLFFRATNFGRQEPDLLRWIESHYEADEVFFDIGANIGYFSLFAARKMRVHVYAFEPESLTFASLNRNIFYNQLSDRIVALPIALSNSEKVAFLHLKNFVPGNAYNTFGTAIDFRGHAFEPDFRQGSVGMSLDYFLSQFGVTAPHHIKIDVDGGEAEIVQGMQQTLASKSLRTLCIELTPARPEHAAIIESVRMHGFHEDRGFVNVERDRVGTRNFYFARS